MIKYNWYNNLDKTEKHPHFSIPKEVTAIKKVESVGSGYSEHNFKQKVDTL